MKRVSSAQKKGKAPKGKRKALPKSKKGVSVRLAKKVSKKPTKGRTAAFSKPRKALRKSTIKVVPPPIVISEKPVATPVVRAFDQAIKTFNRQDFARAREAFEDLIGRFPTEADIVARARAYITICQQRLAHPPQFPRSSEALYDRGIIELNRGQFTMAMNYFERALKLEPEADHVVYALASVFAQMGELDKALAALKRSIDLNEGYRIQARRDPDFRSLYVSDDFQKLVGLEIME
jgi:tetratricopeptide (TPR) repeat protein